MRVTYQLRGQLMRTPRARLSLNQGGLSPSLAAASPRWGITCGSRHCRAARPSSFAEMETGKAPPIPGGTGHSRRPPDHASAPPPTPLLLDHRILFAADDDWL